MSKGKILWVGDSSAEQSDRQRGTSWATTGFGRVTEQTLGRLQALGWEVVLLGVNHPGDEHYQPYRIYQAIWGGDALGMGRLPKLIEEEQPDVVVLFNDPWVVPGYLAQMSRLDTMPPTVAYMPIDATGYDEEIVAPLKRAAEAKDATFHAATYCQWGADEYRKGGYPAPMTVIPHGVDTFTFFPMKKAQCKALHGIPQSSYVVLNANRNSVRKRIDITVRAFMKFAARERITGPEEALLWLHMSPREDYDLLRLVRRAGADEGVENPERLVKMNPIGFSNSNALTNDTLRTVYNAADVNVNTSMGEGWGLVAMEAAACGVPSILGRHSAHLDIWSDVSAYRVPVWEYQASPNLHLNHAVLSACDVSRAISAAYISKDMRALTAEHAKRTVMEDRYSWDSVARQWDTLLSQIAKGEKPDGQ